MKIRIEVPEDLKALEKELQNLAWDAPVEALTGLRSLELAAEYIAAGVVQVTCTVEAFPSSWTGSRCKPVQAYPGAAWAAVFQEIGTALGMALTGDKTPSNVYNSDTEIVYLRDEDTDGALATYVADYLAPFIKNVASM